MIFEMRKLQGLLKFQYTTDALNEHNPFITRNNAKHGVTIDELALLFNAFEFSYIS